MAFQIRRWIKEPFPGLSHLLGAVLSIVAMVLLITVAKGRPLYVTGFAIYAASMFILFLASGLTHSVHGSPRMEDVLERLDYSGIFLLIAGTYTPICLVTLHGPWGWSLLIAIWIIALIGVASVWLIRTLKSRLRTVLYVAMGWLAIIATGKIYEAFPAGALWLLLSGGALYSLGAIVFVTDRPHPWPGRFAAHDLWHVMVLGGSACHFFLMLRFVAI